MMFSQQTKRSLDYNEGNWGQSESNDRKKKKRSRWNTEEAEKTSIPGMPTALPANVTPEQERQYLVHLQIEEISRRLRSGDLGIPANPEDRSPSPEPIYNNEGKRLNTREYRTRKKLEEERHKLVQEALAFNSDYKPPADYKPPVIRVSDKVMIPQEEHPDINFVGLLIGPRGNTLKNLEKETGAKIIIRGKGSVKDGKIGRKDGQPLPGEDEPLHAYVTANNPENVKKAVEKIKDIIKQGIEVPEGQNDLRRQQLRELALLNGTLRENDGLAKLKQLQQAQTIITNTIVCSVCGGTGHIAQDCKQKKPGEAFPAIMPPPQSSADKAKMDSEYMSLMAELGEGPPPKQQPSAPSQPAPSQPLQPRPQPPQQPHQAMQPAFRPAFQRPPNPMAINPPWQQAMSNQRPPMGPPPGLQPQQPPQAMQNPHLQPPTSIPPNPLMQMQISVSSQLAAQVTTPHHIFSSPATTSIPPWQQQQQQQQPPAMSTVPASSGATAMGVPPPPSLLTAPPPPPPPNSQPASLPWLQHQQRMRLPSAGPVPPPPPTSSSAAPWQAAAVSSAPPPLPAALPPWQQQQAPPPPVQPPLPNPVPPPPPPGNLQPGFPHMAPPPPPPGGFDVNSMNGVLVAPPPPPPPS